MPDRKSIVSSLMPLMMERRKKRLSDIESAKKKTQTGGMFDIIYKKRKEREKGLSDVEY